MCICKCFFLIFALLGAAVFVLGFVLGFAIFDNLIEDEVIERVRLKPGTEQFTRWTNPVNRNYLMVYFFHVTNVAEVTSGQARPNVEERGPYIYSPGLTRTGAVHFPTTDTLTYQLNRNFIFNTAASAPRLAIDKITVLNVPLQATLEMFYEDNMMEIFNTYWQQAFNIEDDNTTPLFLTISVQDYLFNGYRFCDDVLVALPLCSIVRTRALTNKMLRLDATTVVFSFFTYMQSSRTFAISAGIQDHEILGDTSSMDGSTKLTTWNADSCNNITGTDSTIFAPFIEEESTLNVFYADICRMFELEFLKHTEFEEIDGYRFSLRTNVFSAAAPDRACHCIRRTPNLDGQRICLPNGFEDMDTCLNNYLLLSFPHLLDADINVRNTVTGLNPNPDAHQSYVDVQTDLGTPLETSRRFQLNMFIRQNIFLADGADNTPFVLPVLWFDDHMKLHGDQVENIQDDFLSWLTTLEIITWVLVAGGAAVAVVCTILCICC